MPYITTAHISNLRQTWHAMHTAHPTLLKSPTSDIRQVDLGVTILSLAMLYFFVHFMHMDIPESTANALRPLTDALYNIFERAVADATAHLEAKTTELRGRHDDEALDPFVFSQLVRFYASELLASGQFARLGYRFERLPNCGIFLEHAGYQIRIWKADEGKLPAPGNSQSKQDFYQQPLFPDAMPRKLALLWESCRNGRVALILACPKGEGDPWESGQSHWEVSLPHPATMARAASASGSTTDDFDDLTFDRKIGTRDPNDND